ncbi:AMP-binding protein [Bradyrhizobium sp.]|uniref:AMP-binding protein n=1 Tax=Bradyrhizobium sp. TaxID=376 RepID=UPI0039C8A2EE
MPASSRVGSRCRVGAGDPVMGGAMASQGTLSWPMTRALATRPNAQAIVDGETCLTYAQWGRRVRGLTAGLRNLGLRTGDVIASIGQNSFRHLECWVGIPAAGMVLNDLNYRLAVRELEFIINDCEARAIVADGAYLEVARQLKQLCPSLECLVYFGTESAPGGWVHWDDLCSATPLDEDHPSSARSPRIRLPPSPTLAARPVGPRA